MSSKLATEHVEDLLPDPAAFREGREREVVRVNLSKPWKLKPRKGQLKMVKKRQERDCWVQVVAQLAERSFPTPTTCGSNPAIGKNFKNNGNCIEM